MLTPEPPLAEPQAIRACLTPTLAAEFVHELEIVLERVERSRDLADLMLCRTTTEPLAKAGQITRAGEDATAVPF